MTGPRVTTKEAPKRVRVSGHRDVTTVVGKDPDYYYRWVHDTGHRIQRYLEAGYEFVDASKENSLVVGEAKIGKRTDVGSVYTAPYSRENNNELLYLMRQRNEYREEDNREKELGIKQTEDAMLRRYDADDPRDEGRYGEIKRTRN